MHVGQHRRAEFVTDVPRTESGKLQRRPIRDLFAGGAVPE